MPKASELGDQDPVMQLNYSAIGCGKTHFAMTAGSDFVWLVPPNRLSTIKSCLRLGISDPIIEIVNRDIDVTQAKSYDQYCDLMDYYTVGAGRDKVKGIVLDELDHIRRAAMVKGIHISAVDGKSQTLKKAKSGISEGLVMAAIQDYGAEMSLVEQFISYYTEVCASKGLHLIVNAHERFTYVKNAKNEDVLARISPGFTGKTFPDDVIGSFDNVWRFVRTVSAGSSVTKIDTIGNSTIRAKCCYTGKFKPEETVKEFGNAQSKGITFLDVIARVKGATKSKE